VETRQIGSLQVSAVGLGCNNFGGRIGAGATDAVVGAALDAGITFFDTADIYGNSRSEELLGKAIASRRDEVIIATKFGMPRPGYDGGASPEYVRHSIDRSLQRLGTDHIDLYQLHAPDPHTPIGETLAALDDLVREGKVREIGCSNFSAPQLIEADDAARAVGGARFVSLQNQYSMLFREPEAAVLFECAERDIAFLPFFPLANGLLSGKYEAGKPPPEGTRIAGMPAEQASRLLSEESLGRVDELDRLAKSAGHSVLDLAFAWLLRRPEVASVIAGATKPDQVRANVVAARWRLDDEILAGVDRISPPP